MWAMMPIFRVLSRGYSLVAIAPQQPRLLPAVMGESLVGLRHLMGLVALTDRRALSGGGVHQLGCELLCHRLAGAVARRGQQPAHRQRHLALAADLDWHLIGGAADTARLD